MAGIGYVGFTVALNVGVMRMGRPDERVMVFSWFTVGISAGFAIGPMTAGFGIVLYNVILSGLAIGLLILGFARPAPATA